MKLGSRKRQNAATRRAALEARAAAAIGTAARAERRPTGRSSSSTSQRRRDQLVARVAELQWDLGGLVYEMAIRNRIKVEVLVKRAVALQDADAELSEVERIVRMEETGDRRLLRTLRRPAQQRRHLLLAVRPVAARAGLQRRDPRAR